MNATAYASIFAKVAPGVFTKVFRPDACIGVTKIATKVFSYFGIDAKPFSVRVVCHNKVWADHMKEWDAAHPDQRLTKKDTEPWIQEGGWALGIGRHGATPPDMNPNKWDGHLVALLENSCVVDSSLQQADRPQYGIHMPACAIFHIPDDFMTPVSPDSMYPVGESGNGCVLFYAPDIGNNSYKTAPDWKREFKDEVGEIIRLMKIELMKIEVKFNCNS